MTATAIATRASAWPPVARHGCLVGVALGVPLVAGALDEYWASILITASVATIVATGLHVMIHWTGQISLGQIAFVGVGGFATVRLSGLGWPLELAVLGGTVAAIVASALVGIPALRIRGFPLAITTLAAGTAIDRWLFRQEWFTTGSTGQALQGDRFFGFDALSTTTLFVPVTFLLISVVLVTSRVGSSALGRSLRFVAADEQVGKGAGIHVGAHKFFAFLYAGGCAGLGGSLWVVSLGRVGPDMFPTPLSLVYVSSVLLGGPGVVFGTVGAAYVQAFSTTRGSLGPYSILIGSVVLLVTLNFYPGGLNEIARRLWSKRFIRRGSPLDHAIFEGGPSANGDRT